MRGMPLIKPIKSGRRVYISPTIESWEARKKSLLVVAVGDFYSIFEVIVNFPVGAGEGEGASVAGEFFDGEGDGLVGEVGVEFF